MIQKLSDLTARELDNLSRDALSWAYAASLVNDEETADTFRARARAFKALAAREEQDQSHYETSGEVVVRREDVTLDDVERAMGEALAAAEAANDGVEILALKLALDFLRDVFGGEEEKE